MQTRRLTYAILVSFALLTSIFPQTSLVMNGQGAETLLKYALQVSAVVGEEVWPGYDVARYVYLVPSNEPGVKWLSFSPDRQQSMIASFDVRNYNLEDGLSLIFHEAFHAFERDEKRKGVKWRTENSLLVAEYPEDLARNSALFKIESGILFSALQSRNQNAMKRGAREFIAVRKLRQAELEPRFVVFEKGLESNEGLAEYAGAKGVITAIKAARQNRLSIPFASLDDRNYFIKEFERLNSITNIERRTGFTKTGKNSRLRFYYTGSAQGFLLDRLRPDWKDQVQLKGAGVQDLIEEAVGRPQTAWKAIAAKALRSNGYDAILREETEAAAKRVAEKQALLDSLLNQTGLRFVIDASAIGKMGRTQGFDPMNMTVISKQKRIHTRTLTTGEEGRYKAKFDQPVIEDLEKKRYITTVASDEKVTVTVDGILLDLTKPAETRFQKLVISSLKFNLEAEKGLVDVSNKAVLIKLGKD